MQDPLELPARRGARTWVEGPITGARPQEAPLPPVLPPEPGRSTLNPTFVACPLTVGACAGGADQRVWLPSRGADAAQAGAGNWDEWEAFTSGALADPNPTLGAKTPALPDDDGDVDELDTFASEILGDVDFDANADIKAGLDLGLGSGFDDGGDGAAALGAAPGDCGGEVAAEAAPVRRARGRPSRAAAAAAGAPGQPAGAGKPRAKVVRRKSVAAQAAGPIEG